MLPFEGNNFSRGRVTNGDLPFKKIANKHGPKAVTISRFIPFFRTFVPFVAGMAEMKWKTFLPWSVLGGTGWVFACTLAGFFFGNIPFIKTHFELVVLCIIAISVVPIVIEFLKNRSNIRVQTELL